MTDHITTKLIVTNTTKQGSITATAWVHNTPDRVGDVTRKGAFRYSLPLPLLDAHNTAQPVGTVTAIRETDNGIEFDAQLLVGKVQRATELAYLIEAKSIGAVSIGFITRKARRISTDRREIEDAELLEISLVAVPCHDGARITSFKNHDFTGNTSMDTENHETETVDAVATLTGTVADLTAKLETVTKNYDTLNTRLSRPGVTTATKAVEDTAETERKAFRAFIAGDRKALSVTGGTGGDKGGVLAPDQFVAQVQRVLIEASPFRQFASVMSIGKDAVEFPVQTATVAGAWVGENEARPETDMSFGSIKLEAFGWGAFIDVSNDLIADSEIDVMSLIADDFGRQAAKAEGLAFLSGDGVKKPLGILSATGIVTRTTASATAITMGEIIDLTTSLPYEYSANAALYVNRATKAALRKTALAASSDAWGENYAAGTPATLFGVPVRELPDLPTIAASRTVAVYGDLAQAFRVVDRTGMTLLVDPYTRAATNQTRVHVNRRVGGGLLNPNAITFLRTRA